MTTKYRPGPWKYETLPDGTVVVTMPFDDGKEGWVGAECFGPGAEANAAFIVRACNSHEALLVTLKAAQSCACNLHCAQDAISEGRHYTLCAQLTDAIAAAEKGA